MNDLEAEARDIELLYSKIHANHKKVSELLKQLKLLQHTREDLVTTLSPLVQDEMKSIKEHKDLGNKLIAKSKEILDLQTQVYKSDNTTSADRLLSIEDQDIRELEQIENFQVSHYAPLIQHQSS